MEIITAFKALLYRDLTITLKKPQQILNPLVFYIISCSLFPLGISTEINLLKQHAGGILVVNAMLAVIIALDNLFKLDKADGTLDKLIMSAHATSVMVLAKILAHWIVTGLCLVIISPILATMLYVPMHALLMLMLILAMTTLLLTLIGAIGASLTIATTEGTVLNALVTLPLYIPVLIFSCEAITAIINGDTYTVYLLWLSSMLLISCCLTPLITAYSLKNLNT